MAHIHIPKDLSESIKSAWQRLNQMQTILHLVALYVKVFACKNHLAPQIYALKIVNVIIDFLGLEDFRKKLK